MSAIDNIAKELKDKYGNGRVPNIHEILAAVYDEETKSLNISVEGGEGGLTPQPTPEYLSEGATASAIRVKVNELIDALKEAGVFI